MTSNDCSDTSGFLRSSPEHAETNSLLSTRSSSSSDDLVIAIPPPQPTPSPIPPIAPVPRTPNRVRFALDEAPGDEEEQRVDNRSWTDQEDFLHSDEEDGDEGRGGTRAPLLTGIEAPSVTVANDFEFEDLLENARPKSGMRMAFMNMANSIIGAGIIGQPYAFRQAGLGMGIFLLVALTITVDWTINLIVINSKLSGANSFQATVSACFGRPGLIAISVAQWAFAFGGMIAFCIIVGDTIPHVISALFPSLEGVPILGLLTDRRACIIIFILGISYPLSLYRDIAKLAKASAMALVSMLVIILTVVTQGFRVPPENKGSFSKSLLTVNDGVFQAIGVISFAFVCHHNSLLIYGSLKKPTLDRFARVTHYSTGISMVACLLMAVAGFLTFGDKTAGNVLNNFPTDNIMVNIARFCFGLNMLTTLPLEAFVCREVMETYYFPGEPFNMNRHLIFSSALVVSAMALSLMTCDLGVVFELIGATSACALAYILPPLCYMKLASRSWRTYAAGATVAFGVVVMTTSVLQSVYKIISGSGGPTTC
ncbi:transmembrane amino acid transporter protein-domain-containing protein [Tuber brumale]|nr:transmembrane amino acid transporter protein-domain-containing protein [Tuber brumale]